ncbi:FkbM family methyltransferase [Aquipseudomonas alcaligenes]|uniref:FkbM family methyltransferase n=1 Tax=Aquipseudomonas alcaligenes TaxID=43263 RepID=UPI00374888A5
MNTLLRLSAKIASTQSGNISFSQSGEDTIIDFVFRALKIKSPTYLDVGANEPKRFSNTFSFYLKGSRGVLVEPDPALYKMLVQERPDDKCLQVGVAASEETARPFFVMSTSTLNTFSESEAKRYEETGLHKIVRIEKIPVLTIERIINEHFNGAAPDFLTLDVEGLDLEIIESIDFSKYRPTVICVETITFSEDRSERKLHEIIELIERAGYMPYADTYINTIFVDRKKWQSRA